MTFIAQNTQEAFDDAVKRNSKIDACKVYRLMKNCGFKEAINYVNEHWTELRRKLR